MYYLVYGIFYLLSLLPFWVLHGISSGIAFFMHRILKYRKAVVIDNLRHAFPEKSQAELEKIARQFYINFTDTFIETIKLLSISGKELSKRYNGNFEVINNLWQTGKNVQMHSGHFFNWEMGNVSLGLHIQKFHFVGVYMPVQNKVFDRLMLKIRGRFNTHLIPANDFANRFKPYLSPGERYVLALVADQNPRHPDAAYWLPFLGRMAPFPKGPEVGAKRHDTAVVMAHFHPVKRGYYKVHFSLLTDTPRETPDGFITREMVKFVEDGIRREPANYLWSHRKWKWTFDPEKHTAL